MKTIRSFVRSMQSLLPQKEGGVYILAYHVVDGKTPFPVDISLEQFRSQMTSLRNRICSLQEAIIMLGTKNPESTMVVVTFDDAYENFYEKVWPVLKELNLQSTLYVPYDFVEGKMAAPLRNYASLLPCTWKQIQEMSDSGLVSIGSHTITHPNLLKVDRETARHEIVDSQSRIEDKIKKPVSSFAYPKALWSRTLETIVEQTYDNAVIGGGLKITSGNWNRYRLTRIPIIRDMPQDLTSLLANPVWLEERIASWVRPWMQDFKSERHGY